MKQRSTKKWAKKGAVIGVLALLILGYLNRAPLKNAVYTWRAASHVAKAQKEMAEEDWEKAFLLAMTAHKMDNKNVDALRVLFESGLQTKSPVTMQAAAALYVHPESTLEEKAKLLALFQATRDDRNYMALYNRLSEEERKNIDIIYLKAQFLATRGEQEAARSMVGEYLDSGGDDRRFEALYIALLLQAPKSEEDTIKGQERLIKLMESPDGPAKGALSLLWNFPPQAVKMELYPEDLQAWVTRLPDAAAREKLIASRLELVRQHADQQRQEKIIGDAVEAYRESDPDLLCAWLSALGRFDLVLEVADEERGRATLALYDHRLRALALVQGPEAAQQWLEEPHPESSETRTWLSRAKLASQRKDEAAAMIACQRAMDVVEATAKHNEYLLVYQTAAEIGLPKEAVRALLSAARYPGVRLPPSSTLGPTISYLYQEGRLEDILFLMKTLSKQEPGNVLAKNNLAYLTVILEGQTEEPEEIARALVQTHPEVLSFRTTMAMALLRTAQTEEALAVLTDEAADWKQASAADYAIKALAYDAAGEKEEAAKVRSNIDLTQLTPTERLELEVHGPDDPVADLLAEVKFLRASGRNERARKFLEEHLAAVGKDRGPQLALAGILLEHSPSAADLTRAQELLGNVMASQDALAKEALNLSTKVPLASLNLARYPRDPVSWATGLPGESSVAHALAAVRLQAAAHADAREAQTATLETAIAKYRKSNPLQMGNLLSEFARYDLVLALIPEDLGRSTPDLFELRRSALAEVKGPEAAQQWVASMPSPDEGDYGFEEWMAQAAQAHGKGDRSAAKNAWQEALDLAELDRSGKQSLAVYHSAADHGETDMATRAILATLRKTNLASFHSREELLPVTDYLYQENRLADLLAMTRTLQKQDADDPVLTNRIAYLSLVLDRKEVDALSTAADLVSRSPAQLDYHTTLALAKVRAGEYEAALKTINSTEVSWDGATPVDLAVKALVLDTSGDEAGAQEVRKQFDDRMLSSTERLAFSRMAKAAKAARGADPAADLLAQAEAREAARRKAAATPSPEAESHSFEEWLAQAAEAHGKGERSAAKNAWQNALDLAELDRSGKQSLAVYRSAMDHGETVTATRAILATLRKNDLASFHSREDLLPVTDYLYRENRLADLLAMTRALQKREADDPALTNRIAYLSLVLDRKEVDALAMAADLVSRSPAQLDYHTTLALAQVRAGEYEAALKTINSTEVSWDRATPVELAVKALVLDTSGDEAGAQEVRKQFNDRKLSSTERLAFSRMAKAAKTAREEEAAAAKP